MQKCPFDSWLSNLKKLFTLTNINNITQSIKHSSCKEQNYPWVNCSREINNLFREQITLFFSWFTDFALHELSNWNIRNLLHRYNSQISLLDISEKVNIDENKWYDKVLSILKDEYRDDKIIMSLIELLEYNCKLKGVNVSYSAKALIKKMWLSKIWGYSTYDALSTKINTIRSEAWLTEDVVNKQNEELSQKTIDWLVLLFTLQERIYSWAEIQNRNANAHITTINCSKLIHYLLRSFIYNKRQEKDDFALLKHIVQEIVSI